MMNNRNNRSGHNVTVEELFYLFFATYMMIIAAWLIYLGKDVTPFAAMYVTYIGLISVFSKAP